MKLNDYVVNKTDSILDTLTKIDANRAGFCVVLDVDKVIGVASDGDIRRWLIKGGSVQDCIESVCSKKFKYIEEGTDFSVIVDEFRDQKIKFLPIVTKDNCLKNIITKKNMQIILLQGMKYSDDIDFINMDETIMDYDIYQRPWGYYKTGVMNDIFQSKTIIVKPNSSLSLQKHLRREEHWIIANGNGIVQLDDSEKKVSAGDSLFIPKGCKHRMINTSETEYLIFTEVQLGDYFGEDDIIRYEDMYGRE